MGTRESSARVLVILLLFVAAAALAQPPAKTRVIVSTDLSMGVVGGWRTTDDVDDGWAVGMALADPALDVRLVATVLGNSNVAPEQAATDMLLRDVMKSPVRRAWCRSPKTMFSLSLGSGGNGPRRSAFLAQSD